MKSAQKRAQKRARTWLATLAAMGASLALGGCGFTPLYAAPGVTSKLAAIRVIAPEGRTGYLIRQHLDDAFAKDHNEAPAYSMRLSLAEARYPRGVRTDNVATRYEYVLTADYILANLPSGDIAKKGRVRVEVTYDSADQPYASIAAQQDAQDRVAEEAARRIQLELASWLATGEPSPKKKQTVTPSDANSVTPTGLPTGN
jgi:LPS-assembly lipoprotein